MEALSFTVQVKARGKEQLANLKTEEVMSGEWAVIISPAG